MKIKELHLDGHGWFNSLNGEIEEIAKNGEMAAVTWYRQTLIDEVREFNGKYVTQVVYESDEN